MLGVGGPTAFWGSGYLLTPPYNKEGRLLRGRGSWPSLSLLQRPLSPAPSASVRHARPVPLKELHLTTAQSSDKKIKETHLSPITVAPSAGHRFDMVSQPHQVLRGLVRKPFFYVRMVLDQLFPNYVLKTTRQVRC